MSMNYKDRRALKKRLAPKAKRIVELENNIRSGINVKESEEEIEQIVNSLSMVEMFAIEDYIYSKNLLDNNKKF